jgi:hypothetical protein
MSAFTTPFPITGFARGSELIDWRYSGRSGHCLLPYDVAAEQVIGAPTPTAGFGEPGGERR